MTQHGTIGDKIKTLLSGWREAIADTYGSTKTTVKDAGDKAKNHTEEQIEKGGR
jgi:hypothetical protein